MRALVLVGLLAGAAHAQPAPLTADERDLLDDGELTGADTLKGVLFGGIVGFGLGQAAEGRYTRTGWIYTIVDTAALTALGIGLNYTPCDDADCELDPPFNHLREVGVVTLLLSHLVQVADAVSYPTRHNDKLHALRLRRGFALAPIVAPHGDGMTLGLSLRF